MNPTQEYGYVIIPPERHKEFEPKRATDDYWSTNNNRWASIGEGFGCETFLRALTYRRRIEPGEGFELLPDDALLEGSEFTRDGLIWTEKETFLNLTVAEYRAKYPKSVYLAFRRRKSGGWVKTADRLPDANRPFWAAHTHNRWLYIVGFNNPNDLRASSWTHWKYAELPPLPAPEPTPAERAWDAMKDKPTDAKAAFMAGYQAKEKAQ